MSPDTATKCVFPCHILPASSSCFHKYDGPPKRLEVINAVSNLEKRVTSAFRDLNLKIFLCSLSFGFNHNYFQILFFFFFVLMRKIIFL